MKILVLSDSHSALSFMRSCIETVKPDRIIHLGDYYDDACAMAEEYPDIPLTQVPGNCDRYRCPPFVQEVISERIDGVYFYLTHGHHANPDRLPPLSQGSVFLYGHTHVKLDAVKNGIRCLNPGSVSIPKDGSNSCLIYENGEFSFRILED